MGSNSEPSVVDPRGHGSLGVLGVRIMGDRSCLTTTIATDDVDELLYTGGRIGRIANDPGIAPLKKRHVAVRQRASRQVRGSHYDIQNENYDAAVQRSLSVRQ